MLTAFVVALVVSTYYSTKLSHSQRRAEQAEAQLERMQHKGAFEVTPESIGAVPVDAPRDLVCPDGTKLQYRRIIDLTQDSNAQTREWECIGKPRRVGAPDAITQLSKEKGETAHAWPQVLPGSQAVLFTAYGTGAFDDAEIVVVSLKTGDRKTLHRGGSFARYLPSEHLVYLRQNTLFVVPFDLRRLAVTGAPQPVLEEVNTNWVGSGDFDFSQTGTLVYVSSKVEISFPYSIWWLDAKGQTKPLHTAPGLYENPRFSPDGKRLAFELATSPVRADIWVKDLERDTTSRLTHLPGRNNWPLWTPDGKSIVFESWDQAAPGIHWEFPLISRSPLV